VNTFLAAEDALLELSRWQRLGQETRERWALICATAGEYEAAEEIRGTIHTEPELEQAA
jgi:hypothetical protein